jgi:DNA polymerase I-like protein with 3'-5' exonuclease and polymerase domains
MRFAPPESTKASIGALRDIMKVWLLSCLYGATAKSLSDKLRGSTVEQAERFIRENHNSYAKYWDWSNKRVEIFLYETHFEQTCFGWAHRLDPSERDEPAFTFAGNRSRNFPMQATCAEILRFACTMITDDNITVHAPVHDAVLIGAPEHMIETTVERTKQHMVRASELVLRVPMQVGVGEIIRYPNRMMDPRGAAVWNQMFARLNKYQGSPA